MLVVKKIPTMIALTKPVCRVKGDRVEWLIMPDGATAANALRRGEVDWLRWPIASRRVCLGPWEVRDLPATGVQHRVGRWIIRCR